MKRSTDRILTTHTGSLPRPDDLVDLLYAQESGEPIDLAALQERVRTAVAESVHQQIEAGLDVVNDGEMSKVSYSTYVNARLTGFESHVHMPRRPRADAAAFPRYAEWNAKQQQGAARIKRFARDRGLHDRGLAGCDLVVPAEPVLPQRCRLHRSARRRHA
jgi:5-methyltetrahydropteroyltriglutamate--homocysteine methyltransferase